MNKHVTKAIKVPVLDWFYGKATSRKKKLVAYKSDTVTSKMWIFPDGKIAALSEWHYQWLLDNKDVAKKYNIPIDDLPPEEEPIRIAALQAGFVRVNYEHRDGKITFEAMADKLNKQVKDTITALVIDNAGDIYTIKVNLLGMKAKELSVVGSKAVKVFNFDDAEKVNHIPFVTDNVETE